MTANVGIWTNGGALLLILFGVLAHTTVAFLLFDLMLRYVPLRAKRVRRSLQRCGWLYAAIAIVATLAGLRLAWGRSVAVALVSAGLGLLSWGLIWRFGLRKQFPFLFSTWK